jgi:hypothetical protein
VIEIIDVEVISAANDGEVLVHTRVNPGGVLSFTIKGKSESLTAQVQ